MGGRPACSRRFLPCSCQANSLEPPSFQGPNWQRVGDKTLTWTWQEQHPLGSPKQSEIRGHLKEWILQGTGEGQSSKRWGSRVP